MSLVDDRMVPKDYQIAEKYLQNKFDLDEVMEKIRFVAKEMEFNKKNMPAEKSEENFKFELHPTFVSFNPAVWERPNVCMSLPNWTKMKGENIMSEDFSCELLKISTVKTRKGSLMLSRCLYSTGLCLPDKGDCG